MAYVYILICANGAFYTGSTVDLDSRLGAHKMGLGANFTKKWLPVELAYLEVYDRIDDAFAREKQIQGWSRAKKRALIDSRTEALPELSRNRQGPGSPPSTGSGTEPLSNDR